MVSAPDSGSSDPCSSPGRGIVLCSWARHFTVPFVIQLSKWTRANLLLGVTMQKYLQSIYAKETGISSRLVSHLARMQPFFVCEIVLMHKKISLFLLYFNIFIIPFLILVISILILVIIVNYYYYSLLLENEMLRDRRLSPQTPHSAANTRLQAHLQRMLILPQMIGFARA